MLSSTRRRIEYLESAVGRYSDYLFQLSRDLDLLLNHLGLTIDRQPAIRQPDKIRKVKFKEAR